MKQRTLEKSTELLIGNEPLGNKEVKIVIHPAPPNTGVIFKNRKHTIEATLKNAYATKGSILLQDNYSSIIHIEHVLGMLGALGIDNAIVELDQKDSPSYKLMKKLSLATETIAFPNFKHREYELGQALLKSGSKEQNAKINFVTIHYKIGNKKLELTPKEGPLAIKVITNYSNLLGKGEAKYTLDYSEESIKMYIEEFSKSRPYLNAPKIFNNKFCLEIGKKIAGIFYYPQYGFGHGINENNQFFLPHNIGNIKSSNWNPNEISTHSIVDRIGEISLIPGRLTGVRVLSKGSGHYNTLKVLKSYFLQDISRIV